MEAAADLLFMIVDPATGRLVGLCQGPDYGSRCGRAEAPPLPCEGYRVVPLRGTTANGLPFSVGKTESVRCPMAWVQRGVSEMTPLRYETGRLPGDAVAEPVDEGDA